MIDNHDSIDKESNHDEDLFLLYCQGGRKRSLKSVASISGKRVSAIQKLSVKDHWVARASLFDRQMMENGWGDYPWSQDPYQSLAKAIREKIALSVEDYHVPKTVNLAQLGRALEALMRLERLALEDKKGAGESLPCKDHRLTIEVVAVDA